jgi:hydrogenase maturation protease
MHQPIEKPVVVIGYGNTLRGDDAVGPLVIDALADRDLDNTVLLSVTQLVPELAALVARASAVIFVDACLASCSTRVEVEELSCDLRQCETSHHAGPCDIVALARSCFHASPPAWLVTIPATDFESAGEVSAMARTGVESAIDAILNLIARLHESEVAHA